MREYTDRIIVSNVASSNPTYHVPEVDTGPDEVIKNVNKSAIDFLTQAKTEQENRAVIRDTPKGERTAKKIASVFNALTDHNISEADAWTFLLILKLVRGRAGDYHEDDFVDLVSYSSLLSECESNTARSTK